MKLPTVNWPTAALIGGLLFLVVAIFHRPTSDYIIDSVVRVAGIIARAFGGGTP